MLCHTVSSLKPDEMELIELHYKRVARICLAGSATEIECFSRQTQVNLYTFLCAGWYIGFIFA